jgi:N-acetylglucosamine malate deacetylase 1
VLTFGWSTSPGGKRVLRNVIGRAMRLFLRIRCRDFDTAIPKSVLAIAPHPDDEALGCGGTLALFAKNEAALSLVVVTDGSASHAGHPTITRDQMADTRKTESFAATKLLGIERDRIFFLGARDGTLPELQAETSPRLVESIASIITELSPAFILLPCRSDGSSEHDANFALVARAIRRSGLKPRILEYPIWAWRQPYILLTSATRSRTVWRVNISDVLSIKASAVATYASQTQAIPPDKAPLLTPEFLSHFLVGEEFFFER